MARILLALLLWPLGRAYAQTTEPGLGFDFSLSPAYVHFEPAGQDNWVGDKPSYATMAVGAIHWTVPKDETSFGLGGGAFFWGDRLLYPVYARLRMNVSVLFRDSTKMSGFVRRLSVETRVGTMLGTVESTAGKLKPRVSYNALIAYRLGRSARSSLHIGIELGLFSLGGPYQVRTGDKWEDSRADISTVGVVVQFWL